MYRLASWVLCHCLLISGCTSFDLDYNSRADHIVSTNDNIIISHAVDNEANDLKSVNGGIRVGKDYVLGDVSTVNGRIQLGPNTQADTVRSQNGDVQVDPGSRLQKLHTVNGHQRLIGTHIVGNVSSVNGSIHLEDECRVDGDLITNNGRVFVEHSEVRRNFEMGDGSLELYHATIAGDLVVRKKSFWEHVSLDLMFDIFPPRIIIGPHSRIEGRLVANRRIELYVHETARVASIEGVEARYYSGERPQSVRLWGSR